jgi:hypothetical protein
MPPAPLYMSFLFLLAPPLYPILRLYPLTLPVTYSLVLLYVRGIGYVRRINPVC